MPFFRSGLADIFSYTFLQKVTEIAFREVCKNVEYNRDIDKY